MTSRHLWNALRYLLLSNVGMLFFLLGTLLVYEAAGDFALASVTRAPPTAQALIVTGLLVKGGIFLPGLWLPQAHAEAEAAVSALLSGVVVNIALMPLIRLTACAPELDGVIRMTGFGGVFTGLGLAFFQRDIKRLLACSTISQMGFALISPAFGAIYAFAHGAAKAGLFLCTASLPERDLVRLKEKCVDRPLAWLMALAALSISGAPLLIGFHAKYQVTSSLSGMASFAIAVASVGTAALMAPIIMMPLRAARRASSPAWETPALLVAVLLLSGMVAGPYTAAAWIKSSLTLLMGIALHFIVLKRLMSVSLPDGWEKLEHVVGMTCITLIILIMAVYLL
jgi:multicomponent Na+:H+ antiporter subunit D